MSKFMTSIILLIVGMFLFNQVQAREALVVDIYGPGQEKLNVFLADPMMKEGNGTAPAPAFKIHELIKNNLSFLPFLHQIKSQDILGGEQIAGIHASDIDFKKFRLSRVDLVVTIGWEDKPGILGSLEIRAFEVFSRKLILGKGYVVETKEQLPLVAKRFCAELMRVLTGKDKFFRSVLAFVRKQKGKKEICLLIPFSGEVRQITNLDGLVMSPAWSFDGQKIVFTYLKNNRHFLGLWDRQTGQVKGRKLPGNTCISPVFTPGQRIAVSIDPEGNTDIYLLDKNLNLDRALVKNWGIDISPSFDSSGKKMVFVSSRLGNPHIFLLHLPENRVERVTYEGKYNTSPSISPDGNLVAFSRLTAEGHRIFVLDLRTGTEKQISFGPGNDEDPSFGPDGYFIAFTSNRSGQYKLYLTTRNGEKARLLPTGQGEATAPSWGIWE
jgi:TolB protein